MDTMSAGTYYIGDLIYVMNDVWDEVLEVSSNTRGKFKLKDGREFAMFNTAYGNGTYNGISVDSGTIGCIKVEDIIDKTYSEKQLNSLAKILEFKTPFEVSESNGNIFFGDVYVKTGKNYKYIDDEYEYDEYGE